MDDPVFAEELDALIEEHRDVGVPFDVEAIINVLRKKADELEEEDEDE